MKAGTILVAAPVIWAIHGAVTAVPWPETWSLRRAWGGMYFMETQSLCCFRVWCFLLLLLSDWLSVRCLASCRWYTPFRLDRAVIFVAVLVLHCCDILRVVKRLLIPAKIYKSGLPPAAGFGVIDDDVYGVQLQQLISVCGICLEFKPRKIENEFITKVVLFYIPALCVA